MSNIISQVSKTLFSLAALAASCATAYQGWQAHSAAVDAKDALERANKAADGVAIIGKELQGLAETNRQQMSLTLRAYEVVDATSLPPLKPKSSLNLSINFKNVGTTLAHDIHIIGAHKIQSASETVSIAPSDFHSFSGDSTLKTQEKDQKEKIATENFILTESDYSRISGGDVLVLFGQLDYDDVFNTHHYSRFCKMYTINSPDPFDCQRWNDAT
mgnify:CR=1 FL=1